LVAFEMAQQLCARGESVALLAILDTSPLACGRPVEEEDILRGLLAYLREQNGDREPDTPEDLRLRSVSSYSCLRVQVEEAVYRFLGIRDSRAASCYINVNLGCARALADYQPQVYSGPVTLIRAEEARPGAVNHKWLTSVRRRADLGWSDYVTGRIEVHSVPGNHNSMMDEYHVEVPARLLRTALNEAEDAMRSLNRPRPPGDRSTAPMSLGPNL
jgi:thioesterase domain-containing protein